MIRALEHEQSYFFIHIDRKVAISPFKRAIPRRANVVFLPRRVRVAWGTLSVVRAMLRLLRAAAVSGHAFKYYTVLSGSDYPIKEKHEVRARLLMSDRQFMRIDRKLVGEPRNAHFEALKRLPGGEYYGNLIPYHGSMYWSLTADCVRFLLEFLSDNPGYERIHRRVFAPDEIFFHTLVKQSPFAEAISHDFAEGVYPDHLHHANHFIDWAGLRARDHLTLDERDLDDLLRSDALFARKFDEHRSSTLLDMLDGRIHGLG